METFIPDTGNRLFQLAADMVNRSNRNIFLTGKAGTGKTTFLKYIRENCLKQMAVVAPTGVAAINAGGVTIHSFFQLPITLFVPEARGFQGNDGTTNSHSLISRLRMNSEKKKLLQELELLIIDEVSMVRCDTLDAVDTVLRHVRQRHKDPFGGVQVLFIGDLYQLAPVVRGDDWSILSDYYESRFFFSSHVLRDQPPLCVEFDKIYRQKDELFIQLLNQIRNNHLDREGVGILESRFDPFFVSPKDDPYIILTTHNSKADQVNAVELKRIVEKEVSFTSVIEGDFPEKSYPAEEVLTLKMGARVMFIRNDIEKARRYFNGKIGVVTGFGDDTILVQCDPGEKVIELKREKWENIRYSIDKKTRAVEADVAGSFTQFPLRLAWAITIHKSQGLTFNKAIIDAGEAFEAGQVYVALSRCTNLEGLILKSKIQQNLLKNEARIVEFSRQSSGPDKLLMELEISRKRYQEDILLQLFDFKLMVGIVAEIKIYLEENENSFKPDAKEWVGVLQDKLLVMQNVSVKFALQLQQLFQSELRLEDNTQLQDRVRAAVEHFSREGVLIFGIIQGCPVVTDSRIHAKEFNDSLREIFSQLSLKLFLLKGCTGNVDINAFHLQKKKFVTPAFSINAYAGHSSKQTDDIPNLILYQQLRKLRDTICSQKDLPIYIVAGSATLNEMASYLPQSLTELRKISGFGDAKVEKYGHQFLDIIQRYCNERNLVSQIHLKSPKRERKEKSLPEKKSNTKNESYGMYKQGLSIAEIAKERNLSVTTIEGHLAYFVETGDLKIEEFVSDELRSVIETVIKDMGFASVTAMKEKLGNDVSYGQIRMGIAWYKRENNI